MDDKNKNPLRDKLLSYIAKLVSNEITVYLLKKRAQKQTPSYHDLSSLFGGYFSKNHWGNNESVSGNGSTIERTAIIRPKLESLFKKYAIKSILDIPCGDYNWMRYIDRPGITYKGADIVESIVEINNNKYKDVVTEFVRLDVTKNQLPQVGLVLVRDCFVHLSNENIYKALQNIKNSGSTFLLMTSFPKWGNNFDIESGGWRPINFGITPFYFPDPLEIISEKADFFGVILGDKSLCMYKISDILISAELQISTSQRQEAK